MAAPKKTATRRPINVATAKGSGAERFFREMGGLPGVEEIEPEAIAPGVRPHPRHDLRFHGGKIIPDLTYTNFYVGGSSSWLQSDIQNIDQTLAAAMSDPHLNNVMVETQTTSCTFSVALRQARHLQRLLFQARIVVKRQAEVFNEKAVA